MICAASLGGIGERYSMRIIRWLSAIAIVSFVALPLADMDGDFSSGISAKTIQMHAPEQAIAAEAATVELSSLEREILADSITQSKRPGDTFCLLSGDPQIPATTGIVTAQGVPLFDAQENLERCGTNN
ncbi:MAG: hypothetical protein RI996_352 [Candidatus Parcubacteria bacterium]|jgi:hypothetical protein